MSDDVQDIGPADVQPVKGELVKPSTSVTMRGSTEVDNVQARSFIETAKSQAVDESEVASLAIMSQILNAESLDDILSPAQVTHAGEVVGIDFELQDVRWMQSTFDEGVGFYGLLLGKFIANGDPATISCGAHSVMAQAFALKDKSFLPASVRIERAERPTSNGYWPLHLEKAREAF